MILISDKIPGEASPSGRARPEREMVPYGKSFRTGVRKLFVRCAVRGVRPFVRCGESELRHDRFAVHPVEHVDDQRIPVLEARIEDRFAVRGLVVFVQHARAFVIPPEQGDGLRCQLLRLLP